jgi:hypothetical protein
MQEEDNGGVSSHSATFENRPGHKPSVSKWKGLCTPSNSLFPNILQITSLESRFCAPQIRLCSANSNNVNILQNSGKKNQRRISSANPLFNNILPLKSCESRFYRPNQLYRSPNHKRINILREWVHEKLKSIRPEPSSPVRPSND